MTWLIVIGVIWLVCGVWGVGIDRCHGRYLDVELLWVTALCGPGNLLEAAVDARSLRFRKRKPAPLKRIVYIGKNPPMLVPVDLKPNESMRDINFIYAEVPKPIEERYEVGQWR